MKKNNNKIFKKSLSKFTTGVIVVSINCKGIFLGKTINSFASLSLKPPLILFSLDKKSSSLMYYKKARYFSINILSSKQIKLSNYFAKKNPKWPEFPFKVGSYKNPKWPEFPFKVGSYKTPNFSNCLANLECKKTKYLSQGDHVLFIGEVLNLSYNNNLKPLLYFNSKYM